MKNIAIVFIITLATFVVGCAGSETYQGKWNSVDSEGNKSQMIFTENEMILKRSEMDSSTWNYSQNSISIENGSSEYGIKLSNGLSYSILFPMKGNKEIGAIADQNGKIIYIIGRTDFYSYEDVFGLK